jgi:ABC-type nickel/cobalt efflux system permease component RcnA
MAELTPILAASAFFLGVVHTLAGPDHYIPFIALSRARGWSLSKTLAITAACGLGHVLSSIAVVIVAIGLGLTLERVRLTETFRGDLAGWLLLGFGLAYMVWGLKHAFRTRSDHEHEHAHFTGSDEDGLTRHVHPHTHLGIHVHPHDSSRKRVAPWVLFLVFVFGPCEPMIPLVFLPAAAGRTGQALMVALLFSAATILTMLIAVRSAFAGLARIRSGFVERYGHALAGCLVTVCGVAVKLGL